MMNVLPWLLTNYLAGLFGVHGSNAPDTAPNLSFRSLYNPLIRQPIQCTELIIISIKTPAE